MSETDPNANRTRTIRGLDGVETVVTIPKAEADELWPPGVEVKVWPNAEFFMAEFNMLETGAIALSTVPTIAGLRLILATWLSTVRADDPRVIAGLDALEAAQIITPERRAAIASQPSPYALISTTPLPTP